MIHPRGLSELVLIVRDVERAARFYRDVIGLEGLQPPNERWAWFWTGTPTESTRLGLTTGPLLFEEFSPLLEGDRFGRVHFAIDVSRAAVPDLLDRVRASGATVYGPQRFEWMRATSWYFYDPDGHLVEAWSPDETEDGDATMLA